MLAIGVIKGLLEIWVNNYVSQFLTSKIVLKKKNKNSKTQIYYLVIFNNNFFPLNFNLFSPNFFIYIYIYILKKFLNILANSKNKKISLFFILSFG